ncbi:MAG: hypothetical protein ACMUHU_06800 [Thermoplasmatota archaeon]
MEQQKNHKGTEFSSPVEPRIGYKELLALASMVVMIILVFLAVNFEDVDELVDPNISIDVSGSWHSQYAVDGQLPVEGKKWMVLDVNIKNLNNETDFQVSIPHFYAQTTAGDSIWVHNSEDYDHSPIGPGENITVTLIFHIKDSETLSRLEYKQRLSGPVVCDVPPPEPYPIPVPE